MSNITSCDSGSFSTENTREDAAIKHQQQQQQQPEMLGHFHSPHSRTSTTTTNNSNVSNTISQPPPPVKKKRSLPGNPDPSAEVIALSPTTLMATNRFICEICNKGFQRDQNLQLHRRGHNLPWKLKQRTSTEVRKRVYVCPEPSCVHHNPARALGDLTGIKKHFCRKHGEKKWKCDKCSKKYAVQSDWKAHSKICGTREYKCDCGTIFSRRDSFITHRAFCDALAEENNKTNEGQLPKIGSNLQCQQIPNLVSSLPINNTNVVPNPQQIGGTSEFNHGEHKHPLSLPHELMPMPAPKPFNNSTTMAGTVFSRSLSSTSSPSLQLSSNIFDENGLHLAAGSPHMSATALLQKAAQMGATVTEKSFTTNMAPPSFGVLHQQPNGQSFMNQYMHNGQQDPNVNISGQYNGFGANGMSGGSVGMNGVDMFNAILDQSKALSKIIEQSNRSSSGGATNGGSSGAVNVGGSKGSEDVMTLDFLGIGGGGGGGGGGGAHGNFYGGAQQAENGAPDEVWRNWSSKNAGFESFSATSSI